MLCIMEFGVLVRRSGPRLTVTCAFASVDGAAKMLNNTGHRAKTRLARRNFRVSDGTLEIAKGNTHKVHSKDEFQQIIGKAKSELIIWGKFVQHYKRELSEIFTGLDESFMQTVGL